MSSPACVVDPADEALEDVDQAIESVVSYDELQVVRVSVKWILDSNQKRSLAGRLETNAEIGMAIDGANVMLRESGAGWRLSLEEIVDVAGIASHNVMNCSELEGLEAAAEAAPATYQWRTDALNVYIAADLTPCEAKCSFPDGGLHNDGIIVDNSTTIGNRSFLLLHEVGHYMNLHHSFQTGPECTVAADASGCTRAGGGGLVGPYQCCADTCPDWDNVMSYHFNALGRFSACQLAITDAALATDRQHVVEVPRFRRGDVNNDGIVNITDAIHIGNWKFNGTAPEPPCLEAADTNDDGTIDLSDQVFLLDFLFRGGTALPAPSTSCGGEPADTEHFLGCNASQCM